MLRSLPPYWYSAVGKTQRPTYTTDGGSVITTYNDNLLNLPMRLVAAGGSERKGGERISGQNAYSIYTPGVFTGLAQEWTESFPYPNGDLNGQGLWAPVGGSGSLQVIGNRAGLTSAPQTRANQITTGAPAAINYAVPFTFTFDANHSGTSDFGGDIRVDFGDISSTSNFFQFKLIFNSGTVASNMVSTLDYDAPGPNGSGGDVGPFPFQAGVNVPCSIVSDGTTVSFSINHIIRATATMSAFTTIPSILTLTIDKTSTNDSFTAGNFILYGTQVGETDITEKDRVVYNNRVFDISNVNNPDEANVFLKLDCTEVFPSGVGA